MSRAIHIFSTLTMRIKEKVSTYLLGKTLFLTSLVYIFLNDTNFTYSKEAPIFLGGNAQAHCPDPINMNDLDYVKDEDYAKIGSKTKTLLHAQSKEYIQQITVPDSSEKVRTNAVFYNRVSKAGSQTLVEILRLLSSKNGFTMARDSIFHASHREDIILSYEQQIGLTALFDSFTLPKVYLKHTGFVDFAKLNSPMPIYMNMVRDPIERVISLYYFKRSPPSLSRMKSKYPGIKIPGDQWINQEFESCVRKHNPECTYMDGIRRRDMTQLTEFFCGQHNYCSDFNTDEALKAAKENVEKHYVVVGVLEDFNKTLKVFEHYMPEIFKGALDIYWNKLHGEKKNQNKYRPSVDNAIRKVLTKNFTREIEFYDFCKQRLQRQYMSMSGRHAQG